MAPNRVTRVSTGREQVALFGDFGGGGSETRRRRERGDEQTEALRSQRLSVSTASNAVAFVSGGLGGLRLSLGASMVRVESSEERVLRMVDRRGGALLI